MDKRKSYQEIRTLFKGYFMSNGHKLVSSSGLVPNDKTLLFANSGMVQFKDIFTGKEQTNLTRATTIQKCIRAGGKHNDLDNVGYTNRHHTFFEMLGNFSFGDYFKEEAIYFAWHFLTGELGLSKERLHITVFEEDKEAAEMWRKLTGFAEEKIIKIKTNDNFWSMGPTGPCGPCSEIFYDYGDEIQGGLPGTQNQDGPRYTEIWNLVFMQYNQIDENTRVPLDKKSIDTGMGLERLISVLEGKTDNYETSLFHELIRYSKSVIGKTSKDDIVYRILADHARSIAFLMADGVHPSSEGRGYVLRRIIRRALRHLYMCGYKGGDLPKITAKVVELMEEEYPELSDARDLIHSLTHGEEEKFMETLPVGMKFLESEMSTIKQGDSLSAEKAFMLYDTFGFPLDITNDVLKTNNFSEVSDEDFEVQMNIQKTRSKKSWKGSGDVTQNEDLIQFASGFKATIFEGYNKSEGESTILGIFENFVVLDKTCFYPEGGGQIGDIGFINQIQVLDTIKIKDVILHLVASVNGMKLGEGVKAEVLVEERIASANAHSATHLLHHFLREKFGESVVQKGSLVERNKLRFDFSLSRPITAEEIYELESLVNQEIAKGLKPEIKLTTLEKAKKEGAIAFFGEKYGSEVRTMKLGHSFELCGGIHAENSNQICAFKIISEGSVASGIRRIEAITGKIALSYLLYTGYNLELLRSKFRLSKTSDDFKNEFARQDPSVAEVSSLQQKITMQEKEITNLKVEIALQKEGIKNGDFYIKCIKDVSQEVAKTLLTKLKEKAKVVILFITLGEVGTLFVLSSSKELNASEIGKNINLTMQGKGGGGMDFANFGGIKTKYTEDDILKILS